MDIIIGITIFFFVKFISTLPFSIILLNLFFGIPQTRKAKKEGLLLESASIATYIISITIWLIVIIASWIIIIEFVPEKFIGYIIIGMIFSFIKSIGSLSSKNYYRNLNEMFQIQQNHINPNYKKIEETEQIEILE